MICRAEISPDGVLVVLTFAAFSSVSFPKPWIHPTGRDFATQAIATILVTMDGTFEGGRTTGKKSSVYMQPLTARCGPTPSPSGAAEAVNLDGTHSPP